MRIIKDTRKPVVLLGRGDVEAVFYVKVHRISQNAKTKIEAAGGSVEIID
jgi:large subunit ribosomal protein L15